MLCASRSVVVNVIGRSSRSVCRNMSSQWKVLVTRPDMPNGGLDILKKDSRCEVFSHNGTLPMPRNEFLKSVMGTHGIYCTLSDKIDKELLDAAGSALKVVATISVGYDHIDVAECKRRGIRIGNTPDVLTDATAELTMALLLATSRRLPEAIHEAKSGGWVSWAPMWMTGPGLSGATVGIFGFGRIGQAVATRIKSFNPANIYYTSRRDIPNEVGATRVDFDQLAKESDFIICTSALVAETKEIFNKSAFEKMKRSVIFVNTSRGGLVDQDALIEALKNKTIRAAGLDVTTPEPLPLNSPLLKMENCVVLPHIGSATIEARNTMSILTANNILAALMDQKMPAEL